MPETMKLIGSTKSSRSKDENGENVPHLEIIEVILVKCDIVNNDCKQQMHLKLLKKQQFKKLQKQLVI